MTTDKEKAEELIRKLLRLAGSSNRHEAELAMQRAYEIAAKRGIDLDEVDMQDEVRKLMHERFNVAIRKSLEHKMAVSVAANFFNVRPVMTGCGWILIGYAADIKIAEYVIEFLVATVRRMLREFERDVVSMRRRVTAAKRRSFKAGFFYGVRKQLNGAREILVLAEAQFAVALRDADLEREDYMREHFATKPAGWLRAAPINVDAMNRGFLAGRSTTIARPVGPAVGRLMIAAGGAA